MATDNDSNIVVRYAPPVTNRLIPGTKYLGRIRSISAQIEQGEKVYTIPAGIDFFDGTGKDLSEPIANLAQGRIIGGAGAAFSDFFSGVPIDNIFCIGEVSARNGGLSVSFFGLEYAFFIPLVNDEFSGWTMVAKNGLSMLIPCPDPSEGTPCFPFLIPHGIEGDDTNDDGYADSFPSASLTAPAFCAAIGKGTGPQEWRVEYQACAPDDEHNDTPAGLRSPWNRLSSNCCGSADGDDDGDEGDADEDDDPDPDAPCETLALSCKITVRLQQALGNPQKVWCYVDAEKHCALQTGNRCYCSRIKDIAGNNIPHAGTQPLGTVLFVKCVTQEELGGGIGGGGYVGGNCSAPNILP